MVDVITPDTDTQAFQKMREGGALAPDERQRRVGALSRLLMEQGMGRMEAVEEAKRRMGF